MKQLERAMFSIYHYCNLTAFENIIRSRTFRLFDISKSNDPEEMKYAIFLVEKVIIAAFNADRTKLIQRVKKDDWEKTIKDWVDNNLRNTNIKCYALCFSSARDLLSQWRGYADNGQGVAIGIEKDSLARWSNDNGYMFDKVEYKKPQQSKKIRKIADKIVKDVKKKLREGVEPYENVIIEAVERYRKELLEQIVCCKDIFYKEEREWRLFTCDIDENVYVRGFQFSSNNCKRYLDINLTDIVEKCRKLDVLLGPRCLAEKSDIQLFVKANLGECEVDSSKGKYR